MLENLKLIAAFSVAGYLISTFIHRDISSMWVFGATGLAALALVVVNLPIVVKEGRKISFLSSIFCIFLLLIPISLYRWAYVAFDRPVWLFTGLPFDMFIGLSSGILAAMLRYWVVIGHMQNRRKIYAVYFCVIIFSPLLLALVIYYDDVLVPLYTRGH